MKLKRPSDWNGNGKHKPNDMPFNFYYFDFGFVFCWIIHFHLHSVLRSYYFSFSFFSDAIVDECVLVFSIVSFVIRVVHNFFRFHWMRSHSIFDFISSNRNKQLLKMKLCDIRNTYALSVYSCATEIFMYQHNNRMKASTISLFASRTSIYFLHSSYNCLHRIFYLFTQNEKKVHFLFVLLLLFVFFCNVLSIYQNSLWQKTNEQPSTNIRRISSSWHYFFLFYSFGIPLIFLHSAELNSTSAKSAK